MGFTKVNTFHGLVGSEPSKSQRLRRLGRSAALPPRAAASGGTGPSPCPNSTARPRGDGVTGREPRPSSFVARPGRPPISPRFSALSRVRCGGSPALRCPPTARANARAGQPSAALCCWDGRSAGRASHVPPVPSCSQESPLPGFGLCRVVVNCRFVRFFQETNSEKKGANYSF